MADETAYIDTRPMHLLAGRLDTHELALVSSNYAEADDYPVAFRNHVFGRELDVWKCGKHHAKKLLRAFDAVGFGMAIVNEVGGCPMRDLGQVASVENLVYELLVTRLVFRWCSHVLLPLKAKAHALKRD